MLFNKNYPLKKVYYRSFLLLIVIPILIVFMVSIGIIKVMMQKTATSNIQNSQNNIVTILGKEVNEVSLYLSHFVYVNNGGFMELAAKTNTDLQEERYLYTKELEEAFQVAMVPKQDILSCIFYMKDGQRTMLKTDLNKIEETIATKDWFINAKEEKNKVIIGSYDTTDPIFDYAKIRKKELLLVAALAPDITTDKLNKIEMVTLFTFSKAGSLIKENNKDELLGTTVILNEFDEMIYGELEEPTAGSYLQDPQLLTPGIHEKKLSDHQGNPKYTYIVSRVPETDWKIVSYIETSKLTEAFNKVALMMFLVILGLFLLFYFFSGYFLKNIITPIHMVIESLRKIETGDLNVHLEARGHGEIRHMIHSFNHMVRRLKGSIEENVKVQDLKHQAEMRALQSQIQPHFLVNTLNSIRFMAQVSKFDGIRKMAEALIKILSTSFRSNVGYYDLKEELEVLDSYIYLMKIRYSDAFEVAYEIDEEALTCQVPRLILQPIVENAIVHGLTSVEEDIGHLQIIVKKMEHHIYLEVIDDGEGMSREEIEQVLHAKEKREDNYSIGIENVYHRIKLHYGSMGSLEISSEVGSYTKVIMKIPVVEKIKRDEHE
ncbi:MAG TPA: sensor histidine kinase [Candidatus Merdenecus merdavium]|nr:sensor histidine kinase [Candidatus Merdenecus merdavium]